MENQAKYEGRYCGNCGLMVDGECSLEQEEMKNCLLSPNRMAWRLKIENEFLNERGHARTCRCDECIEYWERQQVEPDRVDPEPETWAEKQEKKADQALKFVRDAWARVPDDEEHSNEAGPGIDKEKIQCGIDVMKKRFNGLLRHEDTIKKNDHDTDYRPGSTVSKQADRVKELVDAHWSYQEKLLSAGQDKDQTFTWDQVMEMRKWDYTSAGVHFYGHGYEDAKEEK